jgi:hypothetical protein
VPKEIVSDRDPKFTSNFWKGLFKGFGTILNFNITHHPEPYGQTKRTNQIIEYMLRMYVMDKPSKWEDYLHLVEFSYNNGYHASLKIIPFEALYGRKCNILVSWHNLVYIAVVGPKLLKEMEEKMTKIKKKKVKVAQDRKKICVDKNRTYGEFKVGENAFLKLKAKKSLVRLGIFPKFLGDPGGYRWPPTFSKWLKTNICGSLSGNFGNLLFLAGFNLPEAILRA